MKKGILFFAFGTLISTTTFAESSDYYMGASYLSAETNVGQTSKYNAGYDLHLGYKFNSSIKIEASYIDLGSFNTINDNTEYSIDSHAYSISGLYHYPIGKINLIAKLGYIHASSDVIRLPKIEGYGDYTSGGILLGAGISYQFNKSVELITSINTGPHSTFGGIGLNFYF